MENNIVHEAIEEEINNNDEGSEMTMGLGIGNHLFEDNSKGFMPIYQLIHLMKLSNYCLSCS